MTIGQPIQQHTDVKIMLQLSELYLRRSSIDYQGQSKSSTKGQSHATSYRFASQSIRTYGVLVEVICYEHLHLSREEAKDVTTF